MVQSFRDYFQSTFGGELTNALFIALIFGLIINDLRKKIPIEIIFKKWKIRNLGIKIFLYLIYYIILVTLGLMGVFLLTFILWVISYTF